MIIIVGKTCSGKSTVAKILEGKYHYKRVITYTTRPPRKGERNGDEYYFIPENEFKRLKTVDFFFETTSYNVANGETWYYGTPKDSIKYDNSVIVMNPEGVKKVKNFLDNDKFNIKAVYLNTKEGIAYTRLRMRGDPSDEATRRIQQDEIDFADIMNYYDLAVTTDMFDTATNSAIKPEAIADFINNFVKWEALRRA